jgi:hypothetical protein
LVENPQFRFSVDGDDDDDDNNDDDDDDENDDDKNYYKVKHVNVVYQYVR